MYILGIDPSGNFQEGKGISGFCVFNSTTNEVINTYEIRAKEFECTQQYWSAHLKAIATFIAHYNPGVVSIEDYLLYGNKAMSQVHSKMETPQLIGIIKLHCYENCIPLYIRPAVAVKNRWSDKILERKGHIIKQGNGYVDVKGNKLVSHTKDAIRHAVHCATFELPKEDSNDI